MRRAVSKSLNPNATKKRLKITEGTDKIPMAILNKFRKSLFSYYMIYQGLSEVFFVRYVWFSTIDCAFWLSVLFVAIVVLSLCMEATES